MKYTVDPGAHESAYLQLYRQVRANIVSGAYPAGAKLPSKRDLARDLQRRVGHEKYLAGVRRDRDDAPYQPLGNRHHRALRHAGERALVRAQHVPPRGERARAREHSGREPCAAGGFGVVEGAPQALVLLL